MVSRMGWSSGPQSWKEIEARLSDRPLGPPIGDGNDSPAWSRKREPYEAPVLPRYRSRAPYAELHAHSSFSFLDGASDPEALVEEAARLGLVALALTDHDGFYGVVRFAEAARTVGLPTIFGAELSLLPEAKRSTRGHAPEPDPAGSHLLVLARDPIGYAALARTISEAQLAGEKNRPSLRMEDFDRWLKPGEVDHLAILTGCRKGLVPLALEAEGPAAAERELYRLIERFGRPNVFVELSDHGSPMDSVRNDALVKLAMGAEVELVATNNVHYATPADRHLAAAMAAVRSRRSLDEMEGWLAVNGSAHLRSGDEQAARFARYPGVVERAAELGLACAFDLKLMAPELPPFPCPDGLSEMGYLRRLVEERGQHRYGTRGASYMPGAWEQLDKELDLIEALGFPGYFLVVFDIVEFCTLNNIFCQGRGSAANSAVCYVLGITKADAVSLGLLFERFLSPERDGPPDIDLDIESDRREEAIQYVYERHGRRHAAQVANVITYRSRSAVRDAAKALGYAVGQQDAFAKSIDRRTEENSELPDDVIELSAKFKELPRHLGIHSGGMVMCDRPVIEVCPVEQARMPNRTVLQWDKEDCAAAGLVKFDLLGLGMLSALRYSVELIAENHGVTLDLAALEQEDAVYDMMCHADTVGVFQIESRAQMSTLPRLKPRTFYDLVVEIALIRPGPIQGGSVHPYIRRRNGEEEVTYLHPLLKNSLEKTLGIPLFQEQLMQMAIDVAGFTAGDADQLRQAMGSKRSQARMAKLKAHFFEGMAERGIGQEIGDQVWNKLAAFANYGFPESHSISFAYLVYSSSWLKLHYPAAFCAALLNAQPMGFYSSHSLVQDARRHGVHTLPPDINGSDVGAILQRQPDKLADLPIIVPGAHSIRQERKDHGWVVRLGLQSVRHVGEELAEKIVAGQPYKSIEEVARRTGAGKEVLEALATSGAFDQLLVGGPAVIDLTAPVGPDRSTAVGRRQALWTAGAVAQATGAGRLEGIVTGVVAPQLPGMSEQEEALADLWATGVAANGHPTRFLREMLNERGVVAANDLATTEHGSKVLIAGVVTHRQRPATAAGVTFMGLEDETGLMNVVVSVGCWTRYRKTARSAAALLVRGRVERQGAVVNIVAERLEPLPVGSSAMSRDFR